MQLFQSAEKYRVCPEHRVIEFLVLQGWRYDVRSGLGDQAVASAKAALQNAIVCGLPFTVRNGVRSFDVVEVHNFFRWAGRNRDEPTWEKYFLVAGRRHIWDLFPEPKNLDQPPGPDGLGKLPYAVSISRLFNLRDRRTGERLRMRLPYPLESATLSDLHVSVHLPEDIEAHVSTQPGRLEAVLTASARADVEIGMRATFAASPAWSDPQSVLAPVEADLYTRPNEGLVQITTRVAQLAAKLAGTDTDALTVVRRFWNFTNETMSCGRIHYDRLNPTDPLALLLDEGWFDCQTGSALCVALCRARNIPARLVLGYMLDELLTGIHAWFEVWLPDLGWTPFDLAGWELSLGGRDRAWQDFYFGSIDRRMVVERPPLIFTGPSSVRLRNAWLLVPTLFEQGVDNDFIEIESGGLIIRERVSVRRLAALPNSCPIG